MADDATKTRKWWLEATYVTAISAAIIVPGVTLLDHGLDYKLEAAKQEHELLLTEQKQSHEIRQTYLDRAIDPHLTAEYRRSVLSFLSITLDDKEPMKGWAKEELARLEKALDIEARLAAAEAQSTNLQRQLAQARASEGKGSSDVQRLSQVLRVAEAEIASLQKELESAKSKANIAPSSSFPPEDPPGSVNEGANNHKATEGNSAKQASKGGGSGMCCITCEGRTICAAYVSTSCGECGGGPRAH